MSFMSPQLPKSSATIYGGILDLLWSPLLYPVVAAVITIAISLNFFRQLCKTRNKSRGKHISSEQPARDGGNPDISIPALTQFVDSSPGGDLHPVPSQAPPATLEPQFVNKDAGGERNADISTQAQSSTTPRPQPVDHASGDESRPGVLVPLRGPPTTSEPQTLEDRDAPNRGGAAQDSELGMSPTINHLPLQATDEEDNDISSLIETLFIAPERGGEDVQNAEAGHEVDPDVPVPTEAPTVASEPYSGIRRGGDMGSEEVPSITLFDGSSNFQISNTNINAIGGNATIIRFGDGQFTEIQRNLICDYIANLTELPDIKDNLKKHVLTQSIISLPRAKAVFDDYQNKKTSGPCFKGTRMALLREMADWATGPGESRMYVLSGLAGIGKSTVAYTIASRAAELNLLGASFFFSRDEADRKNAEKFFTTIAYQLCVYNKEFATAIGNVLLTERGSAATTKDPHEQLQALIVDPLRSSVQSRSRPILIVVDALDECDEEDGFSVVTGLRQLVQDLPSFKVILTTRPQPYLDHFLRSQSRLRIFHLQNIEDKIVDGDIRLYLQHCLSLEEVQRRYPRRQWRASDEEIDSLVHAAGRLFIIASTAVRFIFDKSASNPAGQMQKLLRAFAQAYTPFKDLDHFYTIILRNVVPADCDDDDIVNRYCSVVGAIIFVQRPLPVSTLAHLINMDMDDIHVVLDHLQSVILLDGSDVPHIYHKSFPEYLTNQTRCKDHRLQINPMIRHMQIATRCFEIMDKHLEYNILGLGDPARFMSNEDGFKEDGIADEQLEEKIPQPLRYACVYWFNHLKEANIEDEALMNGLEKFVNEHMLYWFEVLSLIGNLDSAHLAIHTVLKLLKLTSSDLHQLLSDALRFISKFYETVKRSALHTHSSALPFTPRDSLLYHRYIKDAAHNICAIEGGPEKWDALVATPSHGEFVNVIKFSLDSALFVSSSMKYEYNPDDSEEDDEDDWEDDDEDDDDKEDDKVKDAMNIHNQGQLKIWDAATGTPVSMIPGHRFAVSNDFYTVASSEDKTITFYNRNGSKRSATITASSNIERLALSSESSRVAAALSDGTVWLWESRSAELIDSFDGFEVDSDDDGLPLPMLQFSPTGTRLAYSSANSIKLRDGVSGGFIADLRCGSSHKFEFSGDGSRIASISDDGLTLWNSESGALIGAIMDSDTDWVCLAISANGFLLATTYDSDDSDDSDDDGNLEVTLWIENNNSLAKTEVVKLDDRRSPNQLVSIALLDNTLVLATMFDIRVYDFKTHVFISTLPFRGIPTVLGLSPDCTHLAVGVYHGGVYLWDIRGINASDPPSNQKTFAVTALALSRDCSRLACGFEDGTVELWETSPTKRRIASHKGHDESVRTLGFGPDGVLFASGSDDGTAKLWNGKEGSLLGTLEAPGGSRTVALSNSMLVAAYGDSNVTLWSLDTLSLIHTFTTSASKVSIAENSAFIAVIDEDVNSSDESDMSEIADILRFSDLLPRQTDVSLLDVVNHTTVATFNIRYQIHRMSFLPDNSQLVAQSSDGVYLSLNLINKQITKGPRLEDLIQLPDTSLWHGVPIWHCQNKDQHYFSALFPQHKGPVPVLWIPQDLRLRQWTQGSSMIALGCRDGRVILLRLNTSHVG